MVKVHSTIKLLECVDISLLNVRVENTEAIDYSAVKCEESEQDISSNQHTRTEDLVQDDGFESDVELDANPVDDGDIEKDASNPNTEDPVQDDKSESDGEHRQPARAYPRRTRRKIIDEEAHVPKDELESDAEHDQEAYVSNDELESDAEYDEEAYAPNDELESDVECVRTSPRRTSGRKRTPTYQEADVSNERKKSRSDKDGQANSRQFYSFDDRCKQLLRFKEEFGHCNVPYNQELGVWCTNLRGAYNRIKKGLKPDRNLSQDRIDRLEKMGFQWKGIDYDGEFEKRCRELVAFKEEFGHCNVNQKYVANPSLGTWCRHMRSAYSNVQKEKKSGHNLSKERIERLEEIGFQWKSIDYDEGFEKRLFELETFKVEFGHCKVPQRYAENPSLGEWCTTMRSAYKKIQNGLTPGCNISQERIEKLEELGFQWNGLEFRYDKGFEEHCRDLLTFKEEFGHCNVPVKYNSNKSSGTWCGTVRRTHTKMQKGMNTKYKLSQDRIERLKEIGFQWQAIDYDEGFEKRFFELESFKEEFGHCNVPLKYAANPPLGHWCSTMRNSYNKIQNGLKPAAGSLSQQERIDRLEDIGFQWKPYEEGFEKRCRELIAFKDKFGHCKIPRNDPAYQSLVQWCDRLRFTYDRIKKGLNTDRNLQQDRIDRLEEIGFKWKVAIYESEERFEKRCRELIAFVKEFGHCSIPVRYAANKSLGLWCGNVRTAYNKAQRGEKSSYNLSQERIDRLDEIGFQWYVKRAPKTSNRKNK